MQVRATKLGYFNHMRIREGQEFTLVERKGLDRDRKPIVISAESQFSAKWMEKVDVEIDEPVRESKSVVVAKSKAKAAPVKQTASDSEVI